jgi:hypothetical protein
MTPMRKRVRVKWKQQQGRRQAGSILPHVNLVHTAAAARGTFAPDEG